MFNSKKTVTIDYDNMEKRNSKNSIIDGVIYQFLQGMEIISNIWRFWKCARATNMMEIQSSIFNCTKEMEIISNICRCWKCIITMKMIKIGKCYRQTCRTQKQIVLSSYGGVYDRPVELLLTAVVLYWKWERKSHKNIVNAKVRL